MPQKKLLDVLLAQSIQYAVPLLKTMFQAVLS